MGLYFKNIWSCGNSCDVIFSMVSEKLKAIALDLSTSFPRSPRAVFAGYVIAGRMLDKCRAVINGSNHDYHFDCFLDNQFLGFAEIDADEIKGFISTGATDDEVAEWIYSKAKPRSEFEIIQWNNRMRELKMSELPEVNQVFLESYVPKNLPDHRPVYVWFDVYDLEENRLS
ncbi:MAG: DUF5069 domain-containing protein [Verrucomicrobiota bacterium]|nr:DUF5069 domain-containing protein [Verrucomicrobiota bacterium]